MNGYKLYTELRQVYNITMDPQIQHDVHAKIENFCDEIESNKKKIIKLKRNASYTQRCKEKRKKALIENQEMVQYDKPGRPLLLFKHPNLYDHIHDLIEFGAADE